MFFSEEKIYSDFLAFCSLQRETQDVDPMYPILEMLYRNYTREEALWHTLLYVGYYHLGSATKAFTQCSRRAPISSELGLLPCATERRGFRGGSVIKHIDSVCATTAPYDSLERFFTNGLTDNPLENWERISTLLTRFWGNGRWAAYKTCELLMTVHHYPLEPPNMGNEFSTGPRKGLALFYPMVEGNKEETISLLDKQGEALLTRVQEAGIFLHIAQLETMLCDFHALYEGRYYVGHDIDAMLSQLSILSTQEAQRFFYLRERCLPDAYLGEFHGWIGPDRARKLVYRETGVLLTR